MVLARHHAFQVLTKKSKRMADYLHASRWALDPRVPYYVGDSLRTRSFREA